MSSGKGTSETARSRDGFTALELLLGVMLTVILVMGTAPVVLSFQASATREADRTVWLIQSRVVAARFERDLRMATASGSPFVLDGPVLEAAPNQMVFLSRRVGVEGPTIIEWEIAGSSLMRRWGPCPSDMPDVFSHSLYEDNKTMLEGLAPDASFTYVVGGVLRHDRVAEAELCRVSEVGLHSAGADASGVWSPFLDSDARVGR